MKEYAVKMPYNGSVAAFLYDGVCPYSHWDRDTWLSKGYKIVSESELEELQNLFEASISGHWEEITEEAYNEHLNELPPVSYSNGGFFSLEATTGTLHAFYQQWQGKYYTSLQSIRYKREDIIASLKNCLSRKKVA
ncbi:MAG: hypothetical protein K6F27_09705 [Ruminococcus sp.]|nr:hypothetical protein [Ruminococcus sp.]